MPRYFAEISYKGTNYHGWQEQPNAISVQEVINQKFGTCFNIKQFKTTGCGRTDADVNALKFYLHFDTVQQINIPQCIHKINLMLPNDIALHNIFCVNEQAHSRFDATSRTYHYLIHQQKNAFLFEKSLYIHHNLDVDLMNKASKILFEYQDFSSFCKGKSNNKTNNCTIMQANWEINIENSSLTFIIQANRFLRNMVRSIVGTLIMVGSKKITIKEFKNIIEAKDRNKSGKSVEGKGLYLVDITYPYELQK